MTHTATLRTPHDGLPGTLQLGVAAAAGGEGAVYFTSDGRYAVKVFHEIRPDFDKHLLYVMEVFRDLNEEQKRFIVPPLALLNSFDGEPRAGFVMRRIPPRYRKAIDLALTPSQAAAQFERGLTWAKYLLAARSIANAIVVLHNKGCAHSDIHYSNFLVDLDDGDAVMMEADGVVVAGFKKATVAGLRGFIAPEILAGDTEPSDRTDRHSLAVLILQMLLFRNPLEPLLEYADDQDLSEKLGWGERAVFSEHPHDRRHRPRSLGLPLYRRGALSYRILTPSLQHLTEQALVQGLHDPAKRPSPDEWRNALRASIDELWGCPGCGQQFHYQTWQQPPARRACPFCGERCQRPLPAVLSLYEERRAGTYEATGRQIVLGDGFKLYADVAEPHVLPPRTRRGTASIGRVEWDHSRATYRLVNESGTPWVSLLGAGTRSTTPSGASVPLDGSRMIQLGTGRLVARVVEAGG